VTTRALCSSWVSVLAVQKILLPVPDRPFHTTSWPRRFARRAEECSALEPAAAKSLLYSFPFDSIHPSMCLPASTVMFLGYEQAAVNHVQITQFFCGHRVRPCSGHMSSSHFTLVGRTDGHV